MFAQKVDFTRSLKFFWPEELLDMAQMILTELPKADVCLHYSIKQLAEREIGGGDNVQGQRGGLPRFHRKDDGKQKMMFFGG